MLTALASGFLLGLSCGLAPGPLMALVLAQAMKHDWREGCKVALAPLITDLPIIVVALALASRAAEYQRALAALSIVGGLFVFYLAMDTLWPMRVETELNKVPPRSWLRGVLTNLLNPHPWLFWMTVGAVTLANALAASWVAAATFLGVFYFLLVGTKLLLAVVAGRSRRFLKGRSYRLIMQTLGVLLAGFAVFLLRDGLEHFR